MYMSMPWYVKFSCRSQFSPVLCGSWGPHSNHQAGWIPSAFIHQSSAPASTKSPPLSKGHHQVHTGFLLVSTAYAAIRGSGSLCGACAISPLQEQASTQRFLRQRASGRRSCRKCDWLSSISAGAAKTARTGLSGSQWCRHRAESQKTTFPCLTERARMRMPC